MCRPQSDLGILSFYLLDLIIFSNSNEQIEYIKVKSMKKPCCLPFWLWAWRAADDKVWCHLQQEFKRQTQFGNEHPVHIIVSKKKKKKKGMSRRSSLLAKTNYICLCFALPRIQVLFIGRAAVTWKWKPSPFQEKHSRNTYLEARDNYTVDTQGFIMLPVQNRFKFLCVVLLCSAPTVPQSRWSEPNQSHWDKYEAGVHQQAQNMLEQTVNFKQLCRSPKMPEI